MAIKMRYFLFNHAGSLNHGCEAIVRGTVNIISNADPKAEFVLSSYDPESDKIIDDVEIKALERRGLSELESFISALNVKFRHSEEYALRRMYSDVVAEATDCDICLSVGGDTYCYGDNSDIITLTQELKKNGKKVVLWGASIGEGDLTEDKLKNMEVFDAIFTRESLTYELLKSKNANENIFLNSDPAFCMEREDLPLIEGYTKENTLGLNVSPLIAKCNPKVTEITKRFIEYVINNTTLKVLLVPHVIQNNNNDYDYMLEFLDEFKDSERIAILPCDLNAKQYKGYIARTRFFIGARTHATIAAYSNGVPTIVLGYSVKSRGISKDLFGEEKYVIDSAAMNDENELIKQFNDMIDNEDEIKEILKREIPMKLRSAMELGEELLKL